MTARRQGAKTTTASATKFTSTDEYTPGGPTKQQVIRKALVRLNEIRDARQMRERLDRAA